MSWFAKVAHFFLNLIDKHSEETTPVVPAASPPASPIPSNVTPVPAIPWLSWTKAALMISQSFEGPDAWANITGDFDGAGLTCGALGWTFEWNNQQPLVKTFVAKYGEVTAKSLMPTKWDEYWAACQLPWEQGLQTVSKWSNSFALQIVKTAYRTELEIFWKSPQMIDIQVNAAAADMGVFAQKQALAFQAYMKAAVPTFRAFAYYFDQAVENGTGNTIPFAQASSVSTDFVLTWCAKGGGYADADIKKNAALWANAQILPLDQLTLFKLAYIRSSLSRQIFQTDVMCRRASIAYGKGWVHGELRDFSKDFAT